MHGIATVNTASACSYNTYSTYLASLSPASSWNLEDTGSTAADSSGSNNTGTLSNVTTGITPGPFACDTTHAGMAFNGASPSDITTANSAVSTGNYSEVVMFKTSTDTGTMLGYVASGNHDHEIGIDNTGKLYARIYNIGLGDQIITSPRAVTDGNWHIAVATESAVNGLHLYLDGVLVASNSAFNSPESFTGSWLMGGSWTYGETPYTGDLAQVAVYSSVLTAVQVQTLAADSGFYTASLAAIGIGTTAPNANLDVEGTALLKSGVDSSAAFQIQNATGTSLLVADTSGMTITVQALIITADLTVNGHVITGGSAPTVVAGAAACTGGAVSITGTDTTGTITVTTGTGCSGGGTLATVTFASPFGAVPSVQLTPGNPISQTLGAYVDDSTISTTKFDLGANATPSGSQTFKWNYWVAQ